MLHFVEDQFDEFIEIAEFLLELNGEKKAPCRRDYQQSIGVLFNVEGGVKNTLFSRYRTISHRSLGLFQISFKNITNKKGTKENHAAIEAYRNKLDVLTKAVIAQGDVNLKTLKSAKEPDEKSQMVAGTDTGILPESIRDSFVNSKWYCYENKNGIILQSVMEFKAANELSIEVSIQRKDSPLVVNGIASFIYEDNLLVIKPLGKNKGNYAHYTILVDGLIKDYELFFGHMTYKQKKTYGLTTKTVILQKANDDVGKSNLQEIDAGKEKALLQEYLQNSHVTLNTPPNHFLQIPDFLQRQNESATSSYIHLPLLGHYAVFYKLDLHDIEMTENHIQILELDNKLKIFYTHELSPNEPVTWEGEGYVNFQSHTLTTQLLEIFNGSFSLATSRPTFLLIGIPEIGVTKIEVLQGLITGSRDQNQGSASRLVLLVKLDKEKMPESFNLDAVKEFFTYFKKNSWIDIPRTKKIPALYRFSDLLTIVKEYTKEFGIEFPNFNS